MLEASILSYSCVQFKIQQQTVAQREGSEFRTEPAEGPCIPLNSGFESKCHHLTVNLPSYCTLFNLSGFDFFFSKMGIKMIIRAITSLKGLLKKDEMSFCEAFKTVAGLIIIVVVILIISNSNIVIPKVTL